MKLRLIELFAGYGSQAMALKRIHADFESWRAVEFDKYAIRSYNAVHGTNYEPTDITKIHDKQFGNSIVVSVMCAMFEQLGLDKIEEEPRENVVLYGEIEHGTAINQCTDQSGAQDV